MNRLLGSAFVITLMLAGLSSRPAAAQDKKDNTVTFLVIPNKFDGNPHLALKDAKFTDIETILSLADIEALDASSIKLEGVTLNKGKYTAIQSKLSGKGVDAKVVQIYFARKVPDKSKLSNIKYKGEAMAIYKQGSFGSDKERPVHVFEATVSK
jgi:hypothetical protein